MLPHQRMLTMTPIKIVVIDRSGVDEANREDQAEANQAMDHREEFRRTMRNADIVGFLGVLAFFLIVGLAIYSWRSIQ